MNIEITRLQWRVLVITTITLFLLAGVGQSRASGIAEASSIRGIPEYLKEDLVLYYSFDQHKGTKVIDLSGNGNHGEAYGIEYQSEGKVGAACFFDGADDFISVENIHLEAFTFAAWVKTSTSRINNRRVFLFDSGEESFFAVQGATGGDMEFNIAIQREDENEWEDEGVETGDKELQEDVWTHIAATFDGTRAGIYFNGQLIQIKELAQNGFPGTLYIGGIEAHRGEFWHGAIDEVAVFRRALFAAEVKHLYNPSENNPLVELKSYCEAAENKPQKLFDILERVVSAIETESRAGSDLRSGRGIAHFREIKKESTDKDKWEEEEEKERIIQFQFKGDSSRSDIFAGRKGETKQLDAIYAENPEYGIRYSGGDVGIEDNEIGIFHREIGYDMHPETFNQFYGIGLVRFLSGLTQWAQKTNLRLSVTLSDEGILQLEYERTGDEPNERANFKARIDATYPARFLSAMESSENYEGLGSKTHIEYHVHWKWHGSDCYIKEAALTKKESEFDNADRPDQLCHRYWQQKVEVLAYEAQAAIPDRAFTLLGLPLEEDADIRDRIRKSEYSLSDVLSGKITPGPQYKSLIGAKLPNLGMFTGDAFDTLIQGKMVLICFFEMDQRPSRHCVTELASKAEQLKEKGITIMAVQTSKVDENTLNKWVQQYTIVLPVGMVKGDINETRFTWGVRSLPWLILTDRDHIVIAEGFSLNELNGKIKVAK